MVFGLAFSPFALKIEFLPFALSLSKGGSTSSPRTVFDKRSTELTPKAHHERLLAHQFS